MHAVGAAEPSRYQHQNYDMENNGELMPAFLRGVENKQVVGEYREHLSQLEMAFEGNNNTTKDINETTTLNLTIGDFSDYP